MVTKIKVGTLQEWTRPYVSKGDKYRVYVALRKPLPENLVGDDPDFEGLDYWPDFEVLRVKPIQKTPKRNLIFFEAIRRVDPKLFKEKFAGRKEYYFYVSFEEGEIEGYRVGRYYVTKADVASDEVREWLEKNEYEVLFCRAERLSKFPWERKKLVKTTPILIGEEEFKRKFKMTDEKFEEFKAKHPELVVED